MFKKILISLVLIGSCLYHVTVLAESTLTSRETEQATQLRSLVEKHLREEWTDKCVFLMMFNNIEHYHRPDFPIMLGSRTDAFCIASFVVSEYGAGKKFYALIEIDAKTDLYGISGSSRNFESVESFLKMAGTVINKNIQESNKFYGADGMKVLIDDFNIVQPGSEALAGNEKIKPKIDKEAELLKYRNLIKTKVMQEWIYSNKYVDLAKSKSITTTIRFYINEDGEVNNANVIKKSGYDDYDTSCLRAVKRASPLPLPSDVTKKDVYDGFTIEFSPTGSN